MRVKSFPAVAALAAVASFSSSARAQDAPLVSDVFYGLTADVPEADRGDVGEVYDGMVAAIGDDVAKINEVQSACGAPMADELGARVLTCIRNAAEMYARTTSVARKDIQAYETGRKDADAARNAALLDLAECRRFVSLAEGRVQRCEGRAGDRRELPGAAALASEDGDDDSESHRTPHPVAAARAYAQAHCNAGSQVIWLSDTNFECGNPQFQIVKGKCALDEEGLTHCASKVVSPAGREAALDPLRIPRSPPDKGWCGGSTLCRGAVIVGSVAVVAVGIGYGVHVARTGNWAFVTVEK